MRLHWEEPKACVGRNRRHHFGFYKCQILILNGNYNWGKEIFYSTGIRGWKLFPSRLLHLFGLFSKEVSSDPLRMFRLGIHCFVGWVLWWNSRTCWAYAIFLYDFLVGMACNILANRPLPLVVFSWAQILLNDWLSGAVLTASTGGHRLGQDIRCFLPFCPVWTCSCLFCLYSSLRRCGIALLTGLWFFLCQDKNVLFDIDGEHLQHLKTREEMCCFGPFRSKWVIANLTLLDRSGLKYLWLHTA